MNIYDMKIAVVGGDIRYIHLAQLLSEKGLECAVYGFDTELSDSFGAVRCGSADDAVLNADCLILPMPCTRDGQHVSAPLCEEKIDLLCLAEKAQCPIFAGMIPSQVKAYCDKHKKKIFDYSQNESLALLNAIPTAEGALQAAMSNTDEMLHGKKALITGYGRIGKVLAQKLYGIGVNVTVCARKKQSLSLAYAMNYDTVSMDHLEDSIGKYDIIFNTVPERIMTPNVLENVRKDALLIELASFPGGYDASYASKLGLKAISALALPGKYAPVSAARMLEECITDMLREYYDEQ
ncbi:MAG: dipicolinate synthase subunit DpsA [Clostridia bacterium]|nr:dipicolinate synthase subunit DpsA [Clostridia bacterium]